MDSDVDAVLAVGESENDCPLVHQLFDRSGAEAAQRGVDQEDVIAALSVDDDVE
ncbi:hypothetical protein [Umezawaea sp. Da 62-37]|uniref:hypothetical protein n=1 Tax=Umezawaea sp. Da 62-37 TaxID=3075927 RepID=UPI0028F6C27F|nr:hypothetical protein [Umezawaea sp. Da 62-37]WNV83087.1 hypothetical protein RM788_33525 [Umezawaea sp. Da 62-37]